MPLGVKGECRPADVIAAAGGGKIKRGRAPRPSLEIWKPRGDIRDRVAAQPIA
jgi:hypothetical protein